MKGRIIWLGKTKNSHLASVCEDYADRIARFLNLEVSQLREPHIRDEKSRIEIEGERLLAAIRSGEFVVALDSRGRAYTSTEFANLVEKHSVEDPRDLVFIVGGHAGLSTAIRKRANLLWSLSPLTFSHDLARAILLEQIYRALTIINSHPYAR